MPAGAFWPPEAVAVVELTPRLVVVVDAALPFEFRLLGDNAITEAYAFLFQNLVEDPTFLRQEPGGRDEDETGQQLRAHGAQLRGHPSPEPASDQRHRSEVLRAQPPAHQERQVPRVARPGGLRRPAEPREIRGHDRAALAQFAVEREPAGIPERVVQNDHYRAVATRPRPDGPPGHVGVPFAYALGPPGRSHRKALTPRVRRRPHTAAQPRSSGATGHRWVPPVSPE